MALASRSIEASTADTWRRVLQQIPSLFGRLVFMSSLRDLETNRYQHPSLASYADPYDMDRTLCHSHHQVFSQWINSSLAEQKEDLENYERNSGDRRVLQQYRDLVPPKAREVERQLYLTDLEMLMALMR